MCSVVRGSLPIEIHLLYSCTCGTHVLWCGVVVCVVVCGGVCCVVCCVVFCCVMLCCVVLWCGCCGVRHTIAVESITSKISITNTIKSVCNQNTSCVHGAIVVVAVVH